MKKRYKIALCIFIFMLVLNIISWHFPKAVDWYRLYIFPLGTNTLARFMSIFPWSVGEILILTGIAVVFGAILIIILRIIAKNRFRKLSRGYMEFIGWILLWIFVTETCNCFVLYHATTVEEAYYKDVELKEDTLIALYEMLVENANRLSAEMERDADGSVVYDGDLYKACKEAMQELGKEYPYLKGYYPNPKPIRHSDFMSQQYLGGVYFPFTLEANYNQTMYIMNYAANICHEFTHVKGVILEDEANYYGFLACIGSEDIHLQYSGYLSVLPYVSKEVRNTVSREVRQTLEQPNEMVQKDVVFLTEDAWKRVEKKAVVDTETVNKATNTFMDTTLKGNGVKDGMKSYSRVVRLLLAWYQNSENS